MFSVLNRGTPEMALQDSHVHTIKETSFELWTPGNINHQSRDSLWMPHIQTLPKRVSGLCNWSLAHSECPCGAEQCWALSQTAGQPRSGYFAQVLIPSQTARSGIHSCGLSHGGCTQRPSDGSVGHHKLCEVSQNEAVYLGGNMLRISRKKGRCQCNYCLLSYLPLCLIFNPYYAWMHFDPFTF